MTPEKYWKYVERKVARIIGGKRIPAAGEKLPDVVSDFLVVEVKSRKALPRWIVEALASAQGKAKSDQFPAAVLWEYGESDGILVCSLRDFAKWFCK